ncbi:nuclear transport factor 2 family protein [Acidobacterium sp. S8]|uniref:nuclear transport factor 2 family protein n=1 Tax=Acidobacterium sp. S8 TaxID=1641854 RepID=UPI002110A2CF|nr:nuclear transport factor 2 family protein [Acidobacterium sp. S8]
MHLRALKSLTLLVGITLPLSSHSLFAEGCSYPDLADQHHDAETVQKLESAFMNAFLKGDTDFDKCLLLPNYAEISRSGKWLDLSRELEITEKNRGKNLSVPEMPKVDVILQDDVAIAHGVFTAPGADGKSHSTRFSDTYVWKDGNWHVLYTQQTPADNN